MRHQQYPIVSNVFSSLLSDADTEQSHQKEQIEHFQSVL
jgi:hypothetical protein